MPTTKRKQLTSALLSFYSQPIAKVSLELFLTIGAVIFFAVFAIRPTLLTMSGLIKEIEDKEKLDQQLTQKVAALATAQTEYLQLQGRLPILDKVIPNQPDIVTALKIIELQASEQGLLVLSVNVVELPDETVATRESSQLERLDIPASITVIGNYLNIRNFIEALRNSRRSFVIDTIVFSTEETRGSRQLKANITISLPYYKDSV